MRTNIVLDDELVAKAMELSGINTKRQIVNAALEEYVAARSRLNLMDIMGTIRFSDDYDYKKTRSSGDER